MNRDSGEAVEIVDAALVRPSGGAKRAIPWLEWVYHAGLLLVAIVILWLSFTMKLVGTQGVFFPGSRIPLPDACLSRWWWGWDCPGCGLTRSFICISRGDWSAALKFNPGGPLAYLFAVVQIPWQSFQLWNLARGREPLFSLWLFVFPLSVLGVLLINWMVKFF